MTSIQDCSRFRQEYFFMVFFNFFLSFESNDQLFDQSARSQRANLLIAIFPTAGLCVPKDIEEDLQRIFKIILEA